MNKIETGSGLAQAFATAEYGTIEVDGLRIRACVGYLEDGQPGCGAPFVVEFGKCGYMHWRLCPSCAGCGCAELKTRAAQRAAAKLERSIRNFVAKRPAALAA